MQLGAWTEHKAPDGRAYYFNAITKQSTYTKPLEMYSPAERRLPVCAWARHEKDGKVFFSNGSTSVWKEPREHASYVQKLSELAKSSPSASDTVSIEAAALAKSRLRALGRNEDGVDVSKMVRRAPPTAIDLKPVSGELKSARCADSGSYRNRREAEDAFMALLRDRKVPMDATWEVAMSKGIANDKRFKALKTLNEKKRMISVYSNFERQRESKRRRTLHGSAKRELTSKLDELARNGRISPTMKWEDARKLLNGEACLIDLGNDRVAEDIFVSVRSRVRSNQRRREWIPCSARWRGLSRRVSYRLLGHRGMPQEMP